MRLLAMRAYLIIAGVGVLAWRRSRKGNPGRLEGRGRLHGRGGNRGRRRLPPTTSQGGLVLPGGRGVRQRDAEEVVNWLRSVTPLGQTSSSGLACWDGTETSDELIARADRALYGPKATGRDRVHVDGAPTPEQQLA